MSLERYMYINGVCQSQLEPFIPEIYVIPLEPAATKIPNAVRIKLRLIREIVTTYPKEKTYYKKTLFSVLQITAILSFIQNKLGYLHNWPQDILRYIFYIRHPTNYITVEISAFFYSNKIPRDTALELFEEYYNPSLRNVEIFCEKCEKWHLQSGSEHMSSYYNEYRAYGVHKRINWNL